MEKFEVRSYQKKALTVLDADLKTQKNVLLSAIMAAGKTVITARLVNKYWETTDKHFLILAHKQELVEQFYKAFATKTEIPDSEIGICCAGLNKKQIDKRLTIGSVQTFINFVDDYYGCDLLVVDECHKIFIGTGSQYDQIIDSLRVKTPNMRLLGLSATCFRLGSGYIYGDRCRPGIINLFPKINHKITYEELRKNGFLMSLTGIVAVNDQLSAELENVDKSGDYVLDQLGRVMTKLVHIETAVEAIKKYAGGSKCICVFACTIDHAEKLKDAINIEFPDQATIVHSKLTQIERAANMQGWKKGRKRIMVSVNILVEGFDFPPLDCLIMVRPTESTGLFLQAIGRVLRMSEGKEKALLIDLTTNTEKFGTDLDNMKVTIPKAAAEQGKNKNEKYCPECDEKIHIVVKICTKCGYEWTVEENEKIIAKQMPELKKILFQKKEPEKLFPDVPPTRYEVTDISINTHTSRENGKKLGQIRIYYGNGIEETYYKNSFVSVWLCLPDHYEGYAVEKARETWEQFSTEAFPESVDELEEVTIKQPTKILLDCNGEWPKIEEICFDCDHEELPF